MKTRNRLISSFIVSVGTLACVSLAWGQTGTSVYEGDWPEYHGNCLKIRELER